MKSLLSNHIHEQQRLCRAIPKNKRWPTWESFWNQIPAKHFQRMFQMGHVVFNKLCNKIVTLTREKVFLPERITGAQHWEDNKCPIPGEVKVALSIRLLAGVSYLDFAPLFYVAVSSLYKIFDIFLGWVLKHFQFLLVAWL